MLSAKKETLWQKTAWVIWVDAILHEYERTGTLLCIGTTEKETLTIESIHNLMKSRCHFWNLYECKTAEIHSNTLVTHDSISN